ncbi:MAG TPA: hypothetical protein PLD25_31410 [Chloroflexota bacterium]|nr:hypothetical protein [Chloroflexota bacterium]HUM68239.1 hypothetical protein [Chloroflexota bacterium]
MDVSAVTPSPQLLAANRRLQELRTQVQAQRQASGGYKSAPPVSALPWDAPAPPLAVATVAPTATIATLPEHLGWGSERLTAVTRRQRESLTGGEDHETWWQMETDTAATPATPAQGTQGTISSRRSGDVDEHESSPDWVKLYPDIGLGMLRQELTAPGRLWLMLRYVDRAGCGTLRIDNLVNTLTNPTSPLHFCGKRQLRNLLRDGDGVFWLRGKDCLWLRSAAKVAGGLGVVRLTGRPVALPLAALLGGIGGFRAHLYTAFYSGRIRETPYGTRAMPVARETLAGLSGVGRSSQRAYEAQAGVKVQANFAVGEVSSAEGRENRAWQQGQALFEIKDYRGQQGKRGKTYLAWQLPNSYVGQHQRRPKGRQKRINRELKDLVTKGTPGNGAGTNEPRGLEKRYYPNGKLAAVAYGRQPEQPHYWRWQGTRHGRFVMWQQVGG